MAEEKKISLLSFFGPPGSGKGTVAQRCVRELGHSMLSTGDLLRKHIQEQTDLGKTFQKYVNVGHLIPDDLMTQMVLTWLKEQVITGETIILDGFPRTKGQALLLLEALKDDSSFANISFRVINFEIDEEKIVSRISNRLVCSNKKCQQVYSKLVKMPVKDGICDVCGEQVIKRKDDDASVVRNRLGVFSKFKNDLLGFYKLVGVEVVGFVISDGNPDVVFSEFIKLL